MKKISSELYNTIAATAFAFTLVVVFSILWNLVTSGFLGDISSVFFLEILASLIILQVFDYLLRALIEKLWLYRTAGFVVCCAFAEGAGILFNWFRPSAKNIVVCAVICVLVSTLNYRFWVNKYKADAEEINKKLEAEQGKEI